MTKPRRRAAKQMTSSRPEKGTFAHHLLVARIRDGMTQQEYADLLETPMPTYRNWEYGHRIPHVKLQRIMLDILYPKPTTNEEKDENED